MRTIGGFSTPLERSSTPVIQNPYMDPSMVESETDRSFSQSTLQQTKQQRLLHNPNETIIAQREQEIEEIAQGIIELANIFQELQTMVIDQGSMLDRIDFNVEKMSVDVKAADKELTVATGYQRKSIKRKIILLLLILVAGMIILLGLKLSSKNSTPAPAPAPEPPTAEVPPPTLFRRVDQTSGVETISFVLKRDWRRRKRRLWTDTQTLRGRTF
jgi:syntaxin 16